ncbi:MAG: substrate-binding domain-containing protein [Lachnospiraceae bacterium]|nr:substrate-binding domain-containing protein [Lachnospiraceae bacterium]
MRKKASLRAFILLTALILCFLTGCAGKESDVKEVQETDETITIGMSFDSFLIERWERDRDVFVSTAKDMGAEVNVQNANGVIETQIEQIRYFIKKKVDAIVIVAIDSDRLEGVVSEAKSAGITVVAYDRMLHDANADLYVSFDNHKVGELMAEALADSGSDVKKVLMLSGPTEDENVLQVNSGFEEICKKEHIKISDIFYTPGWKPENAADFLRENPEKLEGADAIMCGNDNIATQTVRLLAEQKKAGQILVTGQDADLEACQRIVQGAQLMTVYKPVEKEARAAAEATIALINGKELRKVNASENDGTYDIPAIILEPTAVNKTNMDEVIIGSGFHLKEDVYLYAGE